MVFESHYAFTGSKFNCLVVAERLDLQVFYMHMLGFPEMQSSQPSMAASK